MFEVTNSMEKMLNGSMKHSNTALIRGKQKLRNMNIRCGTFQRSSLIAIAIHTSRDTGLYYTMKS